MLRCWGLVGGEEKRSLLRAATCVVFPSEWYEGFPVAILEAYEAATPVVASEIGGLSHIVEHGQTGLLFRPGDAADLAAKLRMVTSDPETSLAMGAKWALAS